ncbi:MAG TPA: hypothetical protein VN493_02360 [Thermoanaerobaculia bacterium]|nr:hypothetical protein [Thermoanaerobaculia bacterium]
MLSDRRCTLKGYLYGLLCGKLKIFDRIAGAEIYAIPSKHKEASGDSLGTADHASDLKRALRAVSEEDLKGALANAGLVLKGKTEEDGSFCLIERGYQGGLLDLYAVIDNVPLPKHRQRTAPLRERKILFLGTYDPLRSGEEGLVKIILPSKIWCWLKKLADAWTIVGKVTACKDKNVGIGNVTVTAFDVDWLQQDNLGSDVTSGSGIFRIDYPGETYRKGTWIDVELFGGPDVYFKIVDADGNVLLQENPSQGRTPGRHDSGPCLCVELCVDVPVTDPGPIPTIWTKVGLAFTIPDGALLNGFDADGYAGAAKNALTSVIRMTGSAALTTGAGNPIEYRFLVSDTTTPNGGPPPAIGNFSRIVGVGANATLFEPIQVGQMLRFSPFKIVDIVAQVTDLDANGWLDVNRSIERTFIERLDVDPVDIPDFVYIDSDGLMGINTTVLTTEPDVPGAAAGPGQAVPAGDRIGIEKFAVRFEAREVIDKATSTFGAMPGDGTTLNSMIVNNNPPFLKLAMKEHLESTPCAILTGSIHVAYTVHHPHLSSTSIGIASNDGSYNVSLSDPPIPFAGNTNPALVHANNPALPVPNSPPNVLHKCTYLVSLVTGLRLHNGDGGVGPWMIQTTFFYEP